jgi:hypothetical protein
MLILEDRLYPCYENITEGQKGLSKGRSCTDGFFTLRFLFEKRREFIMATHVAFIDYKKTFYEVNRLKCFEIVLCKDRVSTNYNKHVQYL